MRNRQWNGGVHKGRTVKFIGGKFTGTIAILDELAGDCFYYATDPLTGRKVYGYLGEMEFLSENYFNESPTPEGEKEGT